MPVIPEDIEDLALGRTISAEINGQKNGVNNNPDWEKAYHPCVEAFPDADVPAGVVTKFADWRDTTVYANTQRDLWIYVPDGCTQNANIIFFNDGAFYLGRNGPVRATRVLDSLHHAGDITSTVAVFIMPGTPDETPAKKPIESYGDREAQRSWEYDRLSADHGRFLFHDILPFVTAQTGITISNDPEHRVTCGISSGGIAAFMAAWHFPDQCQRIISHCGSYTNIWGGHHVPAMIRATPAKPLRIFLQSGANDANTPFGDWALANQTMASALTYAGYDFRFEYGVGGHSLNHGGALFADSVRWILRS